MMARHYPLQLREKAVKKALTGESSKRQIADEMGINLPTLQRWVRETRKSGEPVMAKQEKRPQDWTMEERLNALIEASSIPEEELGAWCRQKGLHTHHLEKWRKELSQPQSNGQSSEVKELKKEVNSLKKELNRKNKALAETSALLVLKKKADAIWGDNEDV
jgi:transposase-like protein